MKILASFLLATLMMGCAAIETSPVTSALTVQYATLKYIGDDTDKAQRVYTVASGMAETIQDGNATLTLLDQALRAEIRWERLDAADTLLLDTLLTQLQVELQSRISNGLLSPDDRVRLLKVAEWVMSAALVAGARDG